MSNQRQQNDLPAYLFHQGTNYRSYEFLGCHFDAASGAAVFRVWAPGARSVHLVGDFNGWDAGAAPMSRITDGGIWEISPGGVQKWHRYKYAVTSASGHHFMKADPFAFHAETEGKTASIVYDMNGYEWGDAEWRSNVCRSTACERPMNIYEVHLGSWMKPDIGGFLSYIQIAEKLIPYIKEMNYTHIELLPVMEHPFGGSWGYQITGFYAATSRFGTPHDLMRFIDMFHREGIGVILDWVPSHFPKDAHGLIEFDGAPLFECHGSDRIEHKEWGTRCFDYGRTEVQSFLVSNAIFWLDVYHADGLRVDAVSSMLYLDYGRKPGQWTPNTNGGNENLDAIAFIRKLNSTVAELCPGAMMIAEESTAWPLVSKPIGDGGLGFSFKWNMGWMNDMLSYVGVDPFFRKEIHSKITFSLMYAFSENFILPLSHDEVVHGKKSLLDKMPGSYEEKFAGLRVFLGYMMTHPGKKLTFMGAEFGQFREWGSETALDWLLLGYPMHSGLRRYVSELGAFYLATPALWEVDYSWEGFKWISANDRTQNTIAFLRRGKDNEYLVVLINFSPVRRVDYRIGVPEKGLYEEVFNSDGERYGGWGHSNPEVSTDDISIHGFEQSISLTAPPLAAICLRRRA